jgi:hypothetical protein
MMSFYARVGGCHANLKDAKATSGAHRATTRWHAGQKSMDPTWLNVKPMELALMQQELQIGGACDTLGTPRSQSIE